MGDDRVQAEEKENGLIYFNSQAVGWDSWVSSALKSILWRGPIFDRAAWFFIIILKFIFTPIFWIQIHEKKFLDTKKISFSKADFYKPSSFEPYLMGSRKKSHDEANSG